MSSAAGTSKVEIISQALSLLGKPRVVNDLNENKTTIAVSKLYDTWKLKMLSSFPWNFSRNTELLSQLTEEPINTFWQYAYQLPSDFLMLRAIYIKGAGNKFTNFEIQRDQVWSNYSDNLLIEYHRNMAEDDFPGYFVTAITTQIAAISCMQVTQDTTLTQFWAEVAKEDLMNAKYQDSQSEPGSFIQDNELYAAHYAGGRGGYW